MNFRFNFLKITCQCVNDAKCRSSTADILIYVFQLISMIAFIIAYYPQVRLNFLVKQTDVSIGLVICWTFGDIVGLIGLILQNGLQTQIALQAYFAVIVVILLVQCIEYQYACKQLRSKAMDPKLRSSEVVFYCALVVVVLVGIGVYYWQNKQVIELLDQYEPVSEDTNCLKNKPSEGTKLKVGNILSYITIPFYPLSRIIQIVRNFRLKKTDFLSIPMFLLNTVGNLTQTISLIIDSVAYNKFKEQIAYICNVLLPLILDIVIMIQSIYYNKKNKKLQSKEQSEQQNKQEVPEENNEQNKQKDNAQQDQQSNQQNEQQNEQQKNEQCVQEQQKQEDNVTIASVEIQNNEQ